MNASTQPPDLPNDIESCHKLILAQAETIRQLSNKVDLLLRRVFGSSSERFDPNQLLLDGCEAEECEAPQPPEPARKPDAPKRKGHGRKKLPENLERRRVVHDVPEEEKTCGCGRCRKQIGEKVTEQLDYTPASYYVIQHVQPVYACDDPTCPFGVAQAPKPPQAIEKGLPGPGLGAHVITSKYCDHIPLHRTERIAARHGVELSRKTLWDWVWEFAKVLEPVVAGMRTVVLDSAVLHTDDTPVDVQGSGRSPGIKKGYIWPYVGDAEHPYTVFDYTPSRSRVGPETFLREFTGAPEDARYIQCDAFAGYNGLFTPDRYVFYVACWAHARRKFYEAKTSDPIRAHEALEQIGLLYEVERDAKGLDATARLALRQERAVPVLDAFYPWLIDTKRAVLPKSPIGKAVDYTLSNWTGLNRYTSDGRLAIDNNAAEQAVRAIALGRKNWLFFGSNRGGQAAAIHFSLIASARRHGLDPFVYLRDLLERIPTHPNRLIHELFPDHWKAAVTTEA